MGVSFIILSFVVWQKFKKILVEGGASFIPPPPMGKRVNVLNVFPLEIENIFIDILLPKAKPFTVGLFYRPPSDSNFLDSISCDFDKLLPNQSEIHILGDFNINTLIDGIAILGKKENVKLAASAPSSIGKR